MESRCGGVFDPLGKSVGFNRWWVFLGVSYWGGLGAFVMCLGLWYEMLSMGDTYGFLSIRRLFTRSGRFGVWQDRASGCD